MIAQVNSRARRRRFLAVCRNRVPLGVLLPVHCALFGSTGNFYVGPTLALDANGTSVLAAGSCAPEELASFLGFLGRHRILTDGTAPAGWKHGGMLSVFVLAPYTALALPQRPAFLEQPGVHIEQPAAPGAVADFLFREDAGRRDQFYAELCTKRNHGAARALAVCHNETMVFTVGAYAIGGGQAYMACGETAEALRGQGIGGYLIVRLANQLAAEGYRVSLMCRPERVRFYTRLGFTQGGTLSEYTDEPE